MIDTNSLIEKIVVIGIDPFKESLTYANIIEDQVHPTFLDIYPFEQQETPSYLDNFKLWCFPDGISIYNENLQKINGMSKSFQAYQQNSLADNQEANTGNIMGKNQLHHFVLTNQNTEKKYCSCLMIHEEVYINQDEKQKGLSQTIQLQSSMQNGHLMKIYVPKAICLISSYPVLEFQKQFLAFIYKFTITSKLTKQPPRLQIYQHLFERFTGLLKEEGSFFKAEKKWDEQVFSQTLDHIQQQPQNSEIAKQFKLKEEYLINFSVSMLFRVHTLQNLFSKNTEIIFNISNEEICRLRPFTQQQNNFFSLSNFSFRPLFEKISIKTTISLLQSILLERQIILVSSNPNEIISICESLFTLIYPLKWACIYIPLLPLQLSEMISAMMPYIIGISKKNFDIIKNKTDLKDKVVVNLDDDTVTQVELFHLPEYLSMYLTTNFKELAKKFFATKNEDQKKKNVWFEIIFQLKKIFLNFMTCLINNITPFFLYSSSFDKDNVAARDIFAKTEYVQIFEQNEKSFMTEICQNTMMYSKFLEDSYRILYITEFKKEEIDISKDDKEDLLFFLKNIKKIQKSLPKGNSEKKFDIILNPLIFSSLDYEITSLIDEAIINYQNPTIIDLTPHLIKYLKFIENKNPEQGPTYQQGSAKQITQNKIVFKKLEKEWLMPIPKPSDNIFEKAKENIQEVPKSLQNNINSNNQSSNTNHKYQKKQNLDDSIQSQSTDRIQQSLHGSVQQNGIKSSQHLGSNQNFATVPKENYKDPYLVGEYYQEPSVSQTPFKFSKAVFMEYDNWHNRQFQQEFDRINLNYPGNKQYIEKFDIFKVPETRPYVKNIEEMIYMQDILQRLIYESKNQSQQQQIKQNYSQTNYQENTRGNYQQQNMQYIQENHYFSGQLKQNQHIPANPRFNKNQQNQTTPLNRYLQNYTSQQNHSQLPPLPPVSLDDNNMQNFNTNTEDQQCSNRQSKSLAQLRMKNIMSIPQPQNYSTNRLVPNTHNSQYQQQNITRFNSTNNNNNSSGNFYVENNPIVNNNQTPNQNQIITAPSQRSRNNSIEGQTQQFNSNIMNTQPLQQINKFLHPQLDQKQQIPSHFEQLQLKKASTTTNARNQKRLSIFQEKTVTNNNRNSLLPPAPQKQNYQTVQSRENLNEFEQKENQNPLTLNLQQNDDEKFNQNIENVKNNNNISNMVSRERAHPHHSKNPSWGGSNDYNDKNIQLQNKNQGQRQYSSKQPVRNIFN
ncbi:DENN (AEX-3) domain protein (macronuclear) [Tetrahymena thermophila SB210]|uniref:DENN (AEX-3) domain protein n=1 Tax=Tetrahymena thermophila (strain SB210) TaxID=312017 RepID=I7MIY9_TETTS|nr:DENN (AEX-3) domain protein [Tetrahymena thermophila SB210]EAR95680.2 DENN (AEX-3) domain protein [Tetrahymena thermophila SB210]|eukprot:XP_001015925.2 DENN (AEX-3) domain protein [Tetrahymena thermophila SB210]